MIGVDFNVTGDRDVMSKLSKLADKVAKKLVEAAGRAALKPVVADVRARVPVQHGVLRKSIGTKKAKRTPKNQVVLSVGARWGFDYEDEDGVKRNPFWYAIPVEYGHVVKRHGQVVANVPPAGMFRGAYERHKEAVVERFYEELMSRIEAEVA